MQQVAIGVGGKKKEARGDNRPSDGRSSAAFEVFLKGDAAQCFYKCEAERQGE